MIVIKLETTKKLLKAHNVPKEIPVHEVNRYLSLLDHAVEQEETEQEILMTILEDGKSVFTDEYLLGNGKVRNILLLIQQTFDSTFGSVSADDKTEFLNKIRDVMTLPKKEPQKKEVTDENKDENTTNLSTAVETVKAKKKNHTKLLSKNFVMAASGLFLSVFLIVCVLVFLGKKGEAPKVESLEDYLMHEQYDSAVQHFHTDKDMQRIMRELALNQEIKKIKVYQKKYPTSIGRFYLAFYQEKWAYIVDHPPKNIENPEKTMLAHAYLQMNKVDEAEILNKTLKSKRITTEIKETKIRIAVEDLRKGRVDSAEKIQKEVQDSTLKELIDEAKTYLEMIDLYKKNHDSKNQAKWEKVLSTLGESH